MPTYSVTYKFSQRLPASARRAYEWCTDYEPDDLSLMNKEGTRKIQRLTEDTIILREVSLFGQKKIKKIKLIKLNRATLSWHNIQLSGPNKHSEFLYEIIPQNRGTSRLDFTGHLVVYSKAKLGSRRIRRIAEMERRGDADGWKMLAKAIAKQLT